MSAETNLVYIILNPTDKFITVKHINRLLSIHLSLESVLFYCPILIIKFNRVIMRVLSLRLSLRMDHIIEIIKYLFIKRIS